MKSLFLTAIVSAFALAGVEADAPAPALEPQEAAPAAGGEAQNAAAPAPSGQLDTETVLAELSAALNAVETLQARFQQSDDVGGVFSGTLYLRRPGRLRFEYDAPTPLLIVSDGQTVAIEDSELETVDRAPLRSTPLWWLLKPEINLAQDASILDLWVEAENVYLTVQDPAGEMQGRLTLVFRLSDYALVEWYAWDAFGQVTRLSLTEMRTDLTLNPRLFVLEDEDEGRDRRRGRR